MDIALKSPSRDPRLDTIGRVVGCDGGGVLTAVGEPSSRSHAHSGEVGFVVDSFHEKTRL